MQIASRAITWQQCSTCSYAQVDLLHSKLSIRVGMRGHLSDFECSMFVDAGLNISQSAGLLRFHPQPYLVFTGNGK